LTGGRILYRRSKHNTNRDPSKPPSVYSPSAATRRSPPLAGIAPSSHPCKLPFWAHILSALIPSSSCVCHSVPRRYLTRSYRCRSLVARPRVAVVSTMMLPPSPRRSFSPAGLQDDAGCNLKTRASAISTVSEQHHEEARRCRHVLLL
jgi:hypothetical protein